MGVFTIHPKPYSLIPNIHQVQNVSPPSPHLPHLTSLTSLLHPPTPHYPFRLGTFNMRFRRKKSESDEDSAQEESAVKSRLYGTAEPEARDWEDGLEEQVVAPERETFVDPTRNIYALRKEREQTRAETAKNSIPHEAEPAAESIPAAQLPTQGEKEGVDAFIEKTMKQLEEEAACKLFIGGLSYECTEELLLEKFSEHGDVVSAHIATRTDDDGAKASRGFGFVTYKHRDDAEAAIQELNRSQLMKRSLTVKKQEVSEVCSYRYGGVSLSVFAWLST